MDFGVGKIGAKAICKTAEKQASETKRGPSKFDSIRADLREQLIEKAKVPPKVEQIAPQQKQALENDLRRRLEQLKPQSARELFQNQITTARTGLDQLNEAVARVPKNDAFAPIRERLQSIEKDFVSIGKSIDSAGSVHDPAKLLQMQQQIYGMTENIGILSQVVQQVNTGIKTVLQTQV